MIHPTRTNLLKLKEKTGTVHNSIGILKARRQALIKEFLTTIEPFLRSRREIRSDYRLALNELQATRQREGGEFVTSVAAATPRQGRITVNRRNLLGVAFHEVDCRQSLVRSTDELPYDLGTVSLHTEEAIFLFERILETMVKVALYESKVKRLGEEILSVSRKTRVLEERTLPRLQREIKAISQHLSERERESYFRLKRFKERMH